MSSPNLTYVTPANCFSFHSLPDKEGWKAMVSGHNELVSVRLPVDRKIEHVLRNWHFQPVYQAQENEVHFETLSAENKTWKSVAERAFRGEKWIRHSNGTISYAYANTLTNWNWMQDSQTISQYDLEKITALAEWHDGTLMVGGESGKLYVGKSLFNLEMDQPLKEISLLNSTHYVVKFKDNSACIVQYVSHKVIKTLPPAHQLLTFESGKIIIYTEEGALQKLFCDEKGQWITQILKDKSGNIRALSPCIFLVRNEGEKTLSIWDVNKEEPINTYSLPILFDRSSDVIWVDTDTLALSYQSRNRIGLRFFSYENTEYKAEFAGYWGVTASLLLSDGSIMYASDTSPSEIHILTSKGKVVFSNTEITNNKRVYSLSELADGSVVVKYEDSIAILKPQIEILKSKDYQIEQLLLQVRYRPDDLSLYNQIATLYAENKEKQYQTYVSALIAAIKQANFYQARRFYEKARKIEPQNIERNAKITQIFLSYLKQLANKKLQIQVLRDLNPEGALLARDKSPKHKKRLFVGEGDFSYTEAYLAKHPGAGSHITATELGDVLADSQKRLTYSLAMEKMQAQDSRKKISSLLKKISEIPEKSRAFLNSLKELEKANIELLDSFHQDETLKETIKCVSSLLDTKSTHEEKMKGITSLLQEKFAKENKEYLSSLTYLKEAGEKRNALFDYLEKEKRNTEGMMSRLSSLRKKGVNIFLGIDGTKLHQTFKGKRFSRIQWNCPFGEADNNTRSLFKKIIPQFFLSCSRLQLVGDRVHVTLMQPNDRGSYRQKENPIVLGSAQTGYRLIRKRNFGSDRYPQYIHRKTGKFDKYDGGGEEREFVFEKTEQGPQDNVTQVQCLQDPTQKKYIILPSDSSKLEECYFECSTDEDSSDGFISDEEDSFDEEQASKPDVLNETTMELKNLNYFLKLKKRTDPHPSDLIDPSEKNINMFEGWLKVLRSYKENKICPELTSQITQMMETYLIESDVEKQTDEEVQEFLKKSLETLNIYKMLSEAHPNLTADDEVPLLYTKMRKKIEDVLVNFSEFVQSMKQFEENLILYSPDIFKALIIISGKSINRCVEECESIRQKIGLLHDQYHEKK